MTLNLPGQYLSPESIQNESSPWVLAAFIWLFILTKHKITLLTPNRQKNCKHASKIFIKFASKCNYVIKVYNLKLRLFLINLYI